MAITQDQIDALRRMCPAASAVDLGALIQAAESGGATPGDGIDITSGVISVLVDDATLEVDPTAGLQVKDDGIDTDQIADGAVTVDKLDSGIVLPVNPVAGPAAGESIVRGQVTLSAGAKTTVKIASGPNCATLLSTISAGVYALTQGQTLVINPNAVGNQTWTIAGTKGTSTGTTACATDMSASLEIKLAIALDGAAPYTFAFDWTAGGGCNTGVKIAAQMQTVIQAQGGDWTGVTVVWTGTNHLVITSGNRGTASAVVVSPAADHDCSTSLGLGVVNGGTEAVGTGDAAILARATPGEVCTKIQNLHADLAHSTVEGGKVRINATTTGGGSSLVNASGSANTSLGFANSVEDYGDVGLSLGKAMADANYTVMVTPVTVTPGNTDVISIYNKAVDSFDVYAETPAAIPIEVLIVGAIATP